MHEIETACPDCDHIFSHVIAATSGERLRVSLSGLSSLYVISHEAREITRQLIARTWRCLCGAQSGFEVIEDSAAVTLKNVVHKRFDA